MLLAFVDESYRKADDIYVVAAVVCDGSALSQLEVGFRQIVGLAQVHGVPAKAELHASEMFHGSGRWSSMAADHTSRAELMRQAFSCMESSGSRIFISATAPSKLALADEHDLCLRYLAERIDVYAERRDEYVVVIADNVPQRVHYRRQMDYYKEYGTGGYRDRKLERILDTLHFGESAQSSGLQAADLAAFIYRRRRMDPAKRDHREITVTDSMWQELSSPDIKYWYPGI